MKTEPAIQEKEKETTYAVCLGRQLGSGGRIIAKQLAERLNLKFYDKELIHIAAAKSGYSHEIFEKNDEEKSSVHSFITNLIPFIGNTDFYGNQMDECSLFSILSQTIKELAEADNCIFVGRCAEYILREKKRMTSIFISADMEDRINRIMELHNTTRDNARKMIVGNDRKRASFHDFYSEKQWGKASTYELCINSSKLGIEQTSNYIAEYIHKRIQES